MIKSKKIFLIFLMTFIKGILFADENIWLVEPSEYTTLSGKIEEGLSYKDSWFPVNGYIEYFDKFKSGIITEKGGNFMALPSYNNISGTNGITKSGEVRLGAKLNKRLVTGETYNLSLLFLHGEKDDSITGVKDIFDTEIWVVKSFPDSTDDLDQFLADNGQKIGEVSESEARNRWIRKDFKFTVDGSVSESEYILLVPKNLTVNATSRKKGFLAIEQADANFFEISATIEDKGVEFVNPDYPDFYGVNDLKLIKSEKVHSEIVLENPETNRWNHQYYFEIDATKIGEIELSSIQILKTKNGVETVLVSGQDYDTYLNSDNTYGHIFLKTVDSESIYKINFESLYNNLLSLPEFEMKITDKNDFKDTIFTKQLTTEITETFDKDDNKISGDHNIIEVNGSVVRLGKSSLENDGWTPDVLGKSLFLGKNIMQIAPSHNGWLSIQVNLGVLQPNGTYKMTWTKVFEKEVVAGDQNFEVFLPEDVDLVSEMVLKYSLDRADVMSMENTAKSGESEYYEVTVRKTFDAEIIEFTDRGVPTENVGVKPNLEVNDGKFSFAENVDYVIKIRNNQIEDISNKKLIFMSNTVDLDISSFAVYDSYPNGNEIFGKILRIEKRANIEGIFDILIGRLNKNEEVYLKVSGQILRDDTVNWNLKTELKEGNILLDELERPMSNREYGDNIYGTKDEATEVRHYEVKNDGEGLFLGDTISYSNEIIPSSPTNDGVTLPIYNGSSDIYRGMYVLFTGGVAAEVRLKVNSSLPIAWASIFLNEQSDMSNDESDRVALFMANKKSGSYVSYDPVTSEYYFDIVAPNQPGEIKLFRARLAYNEHEIRRPFTTASSGEVEDYKVVLLPPLEATTLNIEDLGLVDGGLGAGNNVFNFGEKIRYTVRVKNLVNKSLEDRGIEYRTNMVDMDINSVKIVKGNNKTITVTEVPTKGEVGKDKDYEIKFDSFEVDEEIEITFEGVINREDKENWKLIDRVLSENVVWQEHQFDFLNRTYGQNGLGNVDLETDSRHYDLVGGDYKLGNSVNYSNDFNTTNDGVIFPKDELLFNVLYENTDTDLKVYPSNDGYVTVWAYRDNKWQEISYGPTAVVGNQENIVKVAIFNALDQELKLRVRYSKDLEDVETIDVPARTGEVENYAVKIISPLTTKFGDDVELGIKTTVGSEVVGDGDGYYSYKEDIEYSILTENVTSSLVKTPNFQIETTLGYLDIFDPSLIEVYSQKQGDTDYSQDSNSRITVTEISKDSKKIVYNVAVNEVYPLEKLDIRLKFNIHKEYYMNGSTIMYDLSDTLYLTGVKKDFKTKDVGPREYENLRIGYSSSQYNPGPYYPVLNRARHGVVKNADGIHIGLGEKFSIDTNYIESDVSTDDGIVLRTDVTDGVDPKYHSNGGDRAGNILYNRAINRIPVTVTDDGYVSFWVKYVSSYNGFDYGISTMSWNGAVYSGVHKVNKGLNYIDVDLRGAEGWLTDTYYSSNPNNRPYVQRTHTAFLRVRYSKNPNELTSSTGVASIGEVEDYKIESFSTPYIMDFVDIEDLGLETVVDISSTGTPILGITGAGDKHLTVGEEYYRYIKIKNVTRADQPSARITYRTKVAQMDITDYDVVDGNRSRITPSIASGFSSTDGEKEYYIDIADMEPDEEIILKLKFKINETTYPSYAHTPAGNYVISEKLLFQNRLINSNTITLEQDRGSDGNETNHLKAFMYKIDGKYVSLGESVTADTTKETETGNQLPQEGVLNFPKDSNGKNILFSGIENSLDIKFSHKGYVSLWSNIGSSNAWVEILPPTLVEDGDVDVRFTMPNALEGMKDKIFRVRYGVREIDVKGSDYKVPGATGEIEDYIYNPVSPLEITYRDLKDLGTDIDPVIAQEMGITKIGIDDGYFTINEDGELTLDVENLSTLPLPASVLNEKLVKLDLDLADVVDIQAVDELNNLFTDYQFISGNTAGIYYIKMLSMDPTTKITFTVKFKIERENTDHYYTLTHRVYQAPNLNVTTGEQLIHTESVGQSGIDVGNEAAFIVGRHYRTKEEPKLGDIINFNDYRVGTSNFSYTEKNPEDNDGVQILQNEGINTLVANAMNKVDVKISHPGYVQMWVYNPKVGDYKVYGEPQKVDSSITSLEFDLPKSSVIEPVNTPDYTLLVKYGQIKEDVDRLDDTIGKAKGSVSGETETYKVRVIHPVDLKFLKYEELGVDINGTIYGLKDGNVGLGERVRQSILIENRSADDLDKALLDESIIEFQSNNGVVDLNDLNLDVQVMNLKTKVIATHIENVQFSPNDSTGKKINIQLKKVSADTALMISFDYTVKEDNDKRVINKLFLRGPLAGDTLVLRDTTDDPKVPENRYPDMKIDYSSKGTTRHHYVEENPKLGELVKHEDTSVEKDATENDGLVIQTFLRYKESGDPLPTLFSEVENDIKVTASHDGFVRYYLNDSAITPALEVLKGENILKIVPPVANESANGESNDRLLVRYSLEKEELDSLALGEPAKTGEVEDYTVRVLPPLEGYFKIKEGNETRDLGVELNTSAALGAGTVLGEHDGEITYREVFEEVIQLKDVSNSNTQNVEIIISSNIAEVVEGYNTINPANSTPTPAGILIENDNGKMFTVQKVEKSGYTTKIVVDYEAGFEGQLRFKMKVTKEDTTNWKVINNLKINLTSMDNTNSPKENSTYVYYERLLRDYENSVTWGYYHDDYLYYDTAAKGARQYLIKTEDNKNYAGLGEIITAERTTGETGAGLPKTNAAPPGKLADDDSLTPGDINNSSSELHESNGKYYLYNNSMNRFPIEATEDGYVAVWLWRSEGSSNANRQPWDTTWNTQKLSPEIIPVKKGTNVIDLKVDNQWYSNHSSYYDTDMQNEASYTGVLRIKYSLEKDGLDLTKAYILPSGDAGFLGEIEEYTISGFLPPIRVENIEIVDYGFEHPVTGEIFDKGNGTLAYTEEFDYKVTLKNVSTATQPTLTLQHLNEDNYRELLLNGNPTDTTQTLSLGNGLESSLGNATNTVVILQKDGTMEIQNIEPFEEITLTYRAKIVKESQENYDEENPLSDWKKRTYNWYGLDEFWMNRRKLVLDHAFTKLDPSYIFKSKNYILKGSGSDGDRNDVLTSRDYGNGYVGISGKTPTTFNEVMHYRGYISSDKVMMIGKEIDFENTIRDISPLDFDGITMGHAKIDGENVLYAGVVNRMYIEINHPGYVTFFLNEDDFVSGKVGSGSWQNSDILEYEQNGLYVDGSTKGSSFETFSGPKPKAFGPIHYFDSPGKWVVDVMVPEYANKTKVLRVRYGSFEEELRTPLGMSRTGEVQDHKIKIIPLETGFEGSKDLGVPTELYSNPTERLGYNDGVYSYKELYETMFSIHNKSAYDKPNAEVEIYSNTSAVYPHEIDGQSWYMIMDKNSGLDWDENNSLATSKGNGSEQTDKALEIVSQTKVNDLIRTVLRIPLLKSNEMIRIKLNMEVAQEDKTLWRVRNNLVVNNENQGEQLLSTMFRDYGNGELPNNSTDATEVRHYSVKTVDKKDVKLGSVLTTEATPNDSVDDGIVLPTFENELIIYNNLINRIPVIPSHKGYVRLFFNTDTQSWSKPDDLLGVDQNLDLTTSAVVEVDPTDESKNIKVKVDDYDLDTRGILRVRYALDKEDLDDGNGTNLIDLPARSGEVEDYNVRVVSGLELKFEYPLDMGLQLNNGHEDLYLGKDDGNLVIGETINYKVTIKNLTETDQKNIKFIYKTKVTAPLYDREVEENGKAFNIYLRERNNQGAIKDTLLTDRSSKMKLISSQNATEKQYEIEISSIKDGETLVFEFYALLVEEDEENWRLIDQLLLDGDQKDEIEFPMVRDYGNGYVAGDSSLADEARHYFLRYNREPVRLGEKIKTDEAVVVGDDDDGVVNWEIVNNRLVLYNNLKNVIQLTPSVHGFATFWINSSTTNNLGSKWHESKDIVLATRDVDKNNHTEKVMTLTGSEADKLYVRLPSYVGQEKILRVRYTIDKDDEGILKPTGTARTGEVEDYRFIMEDGFDVSVLGMIDRGINSDEATGDEESDKLTRIGVEDGNVSNRELVDTVIRVYNKTPLEQNGFTEEEKDGIKLHIDNGELDTSYIKIIATDKDGNVTELVNKLDESWAPGGEIASPSGNHRVRIRENSKNPYPKGKYYDILIDKIYGRETLDIYVRQKVSDEFTTQKDGKWVIQNTVFFNRAGEKPGDVVTTPVGDFSLPMERDYGVPLNNEDYKTEARHYETKLASGEPMMLGDTYSNEQTPGTLSSENDNGVFYNLATKELAQNFWNEIPIKVNGKGYLSIWIENEKLTLSKDKDSDSTIMNSVTELEIDETTEKIYVKVPKDIFAIGNSYRLRARYAYNKEDVLNRIGAAGSGEVEDHVVKIISGLKLDLLDKTIDKGLLPNLGVEDGFVSIGESIERFIRLSNETDINQEDIDFTYHTDIGEVYKNYFKVLDVDGNIIPNTSVVIIDMPLLPTDNGGKRYQLTLDNLYGSQIQEVVILERVLSEPAQTAVWALKDNAAYQNLKPIERDVPLERDYGSNLLKTKVDKFKDVRHYFATYDNNGVKEPIQLGDAWSAEDSPKNETSTDNGLIFQQQDGKNVLLNNMLNEVEMKLSHSGFITILMSNGRGIPGEIRETVFETLIEPTYIEVKNPNDNIKINLDIPYMGEYLENPNLDKIVRIRYALDKDEIEETSLYATTGEVEDYIVRIVRGLDVKFDKEFNSEDGKYKAKDLGIPASEYALDSNGDRVGFNDGNISLLEELENQLVVTNTTTLNQANLTFLYLTNVTEILALEEVNKTSNRVTYKELQGNKPNTIYKIYEISIADMKPNEELKINILEKVVQEDIVKTDGNFVFENQIWMDLENPTKPELRDDRVVTQKMDRDYGDAYLTPMTSTTDTRHYITKKDGKVVELTRGIPMDSELKPTFQKDDGVKFDLLSDDNIIRNDFKNPIKVYASHEGYISMYLTRLKTTDVPSTNHWNDSIEILVKDGAIVSTVKVNPGENDIVINVPNYTDEYSKHQYVRVRYSLDENEVNSRIGVSKSGEVEDYKVIVSTGINVSLINLIESQNLNIPESEKDNLLSAIKNDGDGEYLDLGLPDVNGITEIAKGDENITPLEKYMQVVKLTNLTIENQVNISGFVLETNISTVDTNYKPKVYSEIGGVFKYDPTRVVTVVPMSNGKDEFFLDGLGAQETIYVKFRMQNVKEDTVNFKTTLDLLKDSEVVDTLSYSMKRDYALDSDGKATLSGRSYLAQAKDTDGIVKEVKLGDIITSDEGPLDETLEDNGTELVKDQNDEYILFNDFDNLIPLKLSHDGYVKVWVNRANQQTSDLLTKVDLANHGFIYVAPNLLTASNKNSENLLRINYSVYKNDLKDYNDYSHVGETEDYKFKFVPGFKVNFEGILDLGIKGASDNPVLVGDNDGNVSLNEEFAQKISIENLSKLPQKNKKLILNLNIGEIIDPSNLILESTKIEDIDLSNNSYDNEKFSAKTLINNAVDYVEIEPIAGGNNYWIIIKEIDSREKYEITYKVKASDENIIDESTSTLVQEIYDDSSKLLLAQKTIEMNFDIGNDYGLIDDETRHYHTKGQNSSYLGIDTAINGTDDGSEILTQDGVGVLYKKMNNKIAIDAKESGYITLWLSDEIKGSTSSWKLNTEKLDLAYEKDIATNQMFKSLKINKGRNELIFKLPQNVDESDFNRVLRVRYSITEDEIQDLTTPSSSGEVEDYLVKIKAGILVYFESTEELGQDVEITPGRVINVGKDDGNVSLYEKLHHTIRVENLSDLPQGAQEIIYEGNITETVDLQPPSNTTTFIVPKLDAHEIVRLPLTVKVIEENLDKDQFRFNVKERVWHDTNIPEFTDTTLNVKISPMRRDYGDQNIPSETDDIAKRAYITTAYLGEGITSENLPKDLDEDDGVEFTGNKEKKQILFKDLDNEITVMLSESGYVDLKLMTNNITLLAEPIFLEKGQRKINFKIDSADLKANLDKDILRVVYSTNKDEIDQTVISSGEIEDYEVNLYDGVSVHFGLESLKRKYMPKDLGNVISGSLIGLEDGFYSPGEKIEHVIRIANNTSIEQENLEVYLELDKGVLLKGEYAGDDFETISPKENGALNSIEVVSETLTSKIYKIKVSKIESQKSIVFNIKLKIDLEDLEKVKSKVGISLDKMPNYDDLDRNDVNIIELLADFDNKPSGKQKHYLNGGYYLGKNYTFENAIDEMDDTDGIIEVDGAKYSRKAGDRNNPIFLVKGQDLKLKLKHSKNGYAKIYLFGNDMGTYYLDNKNGESEITINGSLTAPFAFNTELKVRFASSEDELNDNLTYSLTGEIETYDVVPLNTKVLKYSITESGDDIAEPDEKATYFIEATNTTQNSVFWTLKESISNILVDDTNILSVLEVDSISLEYFNKKKNSKLGNQNIFYDDNLKEIMVAKNLQGEPIELEANSKIVLSYTVKVNKRILPKYDGYILDGKTIKTEFLQDEENEEEIVDEAPPIIKIDSLELDKKKGYLIEREGVITDKITHVIPGDKIIYIIEIQNNNNISNWNTKFSDSLVDNDLLKYSSYIEDSLKVVNQKGEKLEFLQTGDIEGVIKRIKPKEKAIISFELLVDYSEEASLDYAFSNTAYVDDDDDTSDDDKNDKPSVEGPFITNQLIVEKSIVESIEDGQLTPEEEITYVIEISNNSLENKQLLLTDYLLTSVEDSSGNPKNYPLIKVVDVLDNSITLEKSSNDSISNEKLVYDKDNSKITGNVTVKAQSTIKVKFKVVMKEFVPQEVNLGDRVVNRVEIYEATGNKAESIVKIPVGVKVKFELGSLDETNDRIIEAGEKFKYIMTLKNPYHENIERHVFNNLTKQENTDVSIMGDILKFSEIIPDSIQILGIENSTKTNVKFIEKENRLIGVEGNVEIPKASTGKYGRVDIVFDLKAFADIPEEVLEAIDEYLEKNPNKEGAPIHNKSFAFESSKTLNVLYKEAKDLYPLLVQPIERGELIKIVKRANKSEVSVGDLVAYEITVKNEKTTGAVTKFTVEDILPPGFRYEKGSSRIYVKDSNKKNVKYEVDPKIEGNKLSYYVEKLNAQEELKITYLLRVGTGLTPGEYENIAVAKNRKDENISNVGSALVTVKLDSLFDTSAIIGKVFHDRDKDGWQDDATAKGIILKTLTNISNYINPTEMYIKRDNEWKKIQIKETKIGDLEGRHSENHTPKVIYVRREIKDPKVTSKLILETTNGSILTLHEDLKRKVSLTEKGIKARGETAENLRVGRRIVQNDDKYYEELQIYNFGIYEEGIADVKIVTIDGKIITTDSEGRYHIKDIPLEEALGNNFILKVDKKSLPVDAEFTTPNPLIKRVNKTLENYNFGIYFN